MSVKLDCIPCLCRKTVNAVRAVTDDLVLQNAILGEALFRLAMRDPTHSPQSLADDLRHLIATRTGQATPSLIQDKTCPHAH